jgi:hypothetical protein
MAIKLWSFIKQARSCREKVVFYTKTFAKKTAKRLSRREGYYLRSYHCPICERWHLTSMC